MLIVLVVIISLYLILVVLLFIGWRSFLHIPNSRGVGTNSISVVIPLRNEEQNVRRLLDSLNQQNHPSMEIILVDDHSSDNTWSLIHTDERITKIKNLGTGKKAALTTGVAQAKGEIIITTDADCNFSKGWLTSMALAFENKKVVFVCGAVSLIPTAGMFGSMQAIEFAGLIGSAASTWAFGIPTMCNGANLAFRKKAFIECDGYAGNDHIPSGDDEFLMRKISTRYPNGIRFVNSPESIVRSLPQTSLSGFIQQRLRWAGKWRHNSDIPTVAVAIFIWIAQVAILIAWGYAFFGQSLIVFLLLFLRIGAETIFLRSVSSFLKTRWNWAAFLILQAVYPVYVVAIGFLSNFASYSWKERKYR
jgi:biofilm PGA synthesis N-glycosyltransferase PgaC